MKAQKYIDERPSEYFDQFHERVRKGTAGPIYRIVRVVLTGPLLTLFRYRAIGLENIPARGPVILTPNHFSNFDHFLAAVMMPREVQFMAKSQLFGPAVTTWIISHGGTFPVRRGHHDEQAFITAHTILDRGGLVLMYAEGGRSRTKELGTPKPGVGRLALESGAPVVPAVIEGSQHVRDTRRRLRIPKVTVQFGEPISFPVVEHPSKQQSQRAAEEVFARVKEMYEPLASKGRKEVLDSLRAKRREGAPATG
ncbi:MAG: lysophospholipid acyltransferase family protein [Solirubrobacterales bacterium]